MSVFFEKLIKIRFKDIDMLGHVNNATIISFFEEGRFDFFLKNALNNFTNINFILAHLECNYIIQIKINNKIKLKIATNKIGTKSFTFKYMLIDKFNEKKIFAIGNSTQVWYNYKNNISTKIPNNIKLILKKYYVK